MTLFYSRPFEALRLASPTPSFHTVIIGSGYGAAMAALAIAMRKGKSFANEEILVLERGNEYLPGEFPKTMADLPGFLSTLGNDEKRTGYADALFDVRVGTNVNAIVASGLGGTSLINAGVAVDPDDTVVRGWPAPQTSPAGWMEALRPSLQFVRELLGVQPHPRGAELPKVAALRKLGAALATPRRQPDRAGANDGGFTALHSLADIAVSFADGPNAVGVNQRPCNDCGNCFTGCNTAAKNTLAMNAWPLAHSLGVTIVTGANVERIDKSTDPERPWLVVTACTTDADPSKPSRLGISARRVILAAGTFGTTEILHRSAAPDPADGTEPFPGTLSLSLPRLGRQFSLNGDGIAFGFGQAHGVAGCATVPSAHGIEPATHQRPGPTIVSMLEVSAADGNPRNRGLIEDATIPQPIARLWAEALSTQAMTRGYIAGSPSAWHQNNPDADPLAVGDDLMQHHQPLLMMGVDDADGSLPFDATHDHVQLCWPARDTAPYTQRDRIDHWHDAMLDHAHAAGGFDGGLYLPSPLWQPLPQSFNSVFDGASDLGGTHLCNHPLGGCVMADDARGGVVDSRGRVFNSAAGRGVHEGLFVMDGSMIPGALGINPFMTIAALAHHLAAHLDGAAEAPAAVPRGGARMPPRVHDGQKVDWPVPPLAFVFHERLIGPVASPESEALVNVLNCSPATPVDGRRTLHDNVVIDIDIRIPDVYAWLENPSQTLSATFSVYPNRNWQHTIDTVADEDLGEPIVRKAPGTVQLFARDAGKPPVFWRGFRALLRFLKLRRDELMAVARGNHGQSGGVWDRIEGFLRVAGQHSHWRYFRYRCALPIGDRTIEMSGEKRLAYDGLASRHTRDESNLWTMLGNLRLSFVDLGEGRALPSVWFRVDVVRMAKHMDALECTTPAETPHIAAAVASVGALAIRVFLQTHLWSFGAPPYEEFPTHEEVARRYRLYEKPDVIRYKDAGSSRVFAVTEEVAPDVREWRLLRASPEKPSTQPPILLIHGISHSSRVFHTDTLDVNLAGFLLNAGYEVWLLDHGLSTALRHGPSYQPSIDAISHQVSAAVRYVYARGTKGGAGVHVFSHCIGAAATSMSILRGDLMDGGRSMINSLAMHAVPPWIHASAVNLIRAYAGVAFRSRFFPRVIDPIPPPRHAAQQPGVVDQLLDRLGSSLPWTCSEYRLHSRCGPDARFARAICNRMTLLYGYEWRHDNLNAATHRQFASLMGPANVDAYRQLYFFVNRGRVTDREGANAFVRQEQFRQFWTFPTLFLHGGENEAFNVESSCLSAHQLRALRKGTPSEDTVVDLQIVNKVAYGHLDVLLGKAAPGHVFSGVGDFFNRASASPLPEPKSAWLAPTWILTGPIISRPRNHDGICQLRIWSETNEFQTSPTDTVEYGSASGAGGKLTPLRWIRGAQVGDAQLNLAVVTPNALQNSVFWLGDFQVDAATALVTPRAKPGGSKLLNYTDPAVEGAMFFVAEAAALGEQGAVASLATADPNDEQDGTAMNWAALPWYQRFIANSVEPAVSFLLGSCWYPGSWFDQHQADRIFAEAQRLIIQSPGIDHLLLVGDQIYADASYGIFDIAENRERFQQSYRHAFQSPFARWVLSHVPTYFAIDDHEFRDNYPTAQSGDSADTLTRLGTAAIQEGWNFQIHDDGAPPVQGNIHDNHLWYSFQSRGFQYFVFDTRSERDPHATQLLRNIISEAQMNGFMAWAEALPDDGRPAFVVTGSPLAPIPADECRDPARASSSDSLRAYPEFVAWLGGIMSRRKSTLVLLSGDPHFSSMCEFTLTDASKSWSLECISIISSGINVPLPFANDCSDAYEWNSPQAAFVPLPPSIELTVKCSTILSTRRAHMILVDLVADDHSGWRLSVTAIEAGSEAPAVPIVRSFKS